MQGEKTHSLLYVWYIKPIPFFIAVLHYYGPNLYTCRMPLLHVNIPGISPKGFWHGSNNV